MPIELENGFFLDNKAAEVISKKAVAKVKKTRKQLDLKKLIRGPKNGFRKLKEKYKHVLW